MILAVKYLNFEKAEKLRINNFQFRNKNHGVCKFWILRLL